MKNTIAYISPLLPFIGIIEGGVTIFSEVVDNYVNKNATSETEKGNQQNQNTEETTENENKPETENPTMYD